MKTKPWMTLLFYFGFLSLGLPLAVADYSYQGSPNSDTIYFGCVPGSSDTRIIRLDNTGVVVDAITTAEAGILEIHGDGGADQIEALSNVTESGYQFGDIATLPFRLVKLHGGDGVDTLIGTPQADMIWGDNDIDYIEGGGGNDYLNGGDGVDTLEGGSGNDFLRGEEGGDTLSGDSGDDCLIGERGDDTLDGGGNDDVLIGGIGNDDLDGGAGTNHWYCRSDANMDPDYDPGDANTDCNDVPVNVTRVEGDPYTEWAYMWRWGNGVIDSALTTHSVALMAADDAAGAVMLLQPDGEPLHTTHKQYDKTCGPTSLNMVMEHLGRTDRGLRMYLPRDLTENPIPRHSRPLVTTPTHVDAGHLLSMEHIMWEGYHLLKVSETASDPWEPGYLVPNPAGDSVLLQITPGGPRTFFQVDYPLDLDRPRDGNVKLWIDEGPAVGGLTLSAIANKFADGHLDARFINNLNNYEMDYLQAIVRGFIDADIPLVVAVDLGGHFNTLMGYWDDGSDFYIYTADPLEGRGRSYCNKPMRWRKTLLTPDAITCGWLVSIMCYGHGGSTWASDIDSDFGHDLLTGYDINIPPDPYIYLAEGPEFTLAFAGDVGYNFTFYFGSRDPDFEDTQTIIDIDWGNGESDDPGATLYRRVTRFYACEMDEREVTVQLQVQDDDGGVGYADLVITVPSRAAWDEERDREILHAELKKKWLAFEVMQQMAILQRLQAGSVLAVRGLIERDGDVLFQPFLTFLGQPTARVEEDWNYRVVATNAAGKAMADLPVRVTFPEAPAELEYFSGEQPVHAAMAVGLEWSAEFAAVELQDRSGRVLATRQISANTPRIAQFTVGQPQLRQSGGKLSLSWQASDKDGDKLKYALFLSADRHRWTPLALDLSEPKYSLNLSRLSSGTYYFKLLVSDGMRVVEKIGQSPLQLGPQPEPPDNPA